MVNRIIHCFGFQGCVAATLRNFQLSRDSYRRVVLLTGSQLIDLNLVASLGCIQRR